MKKPVFFQYRRYGLILGSRNQVCLDQVATVMVHILPVDGFWFQRAIPGMNCSAQDLLPHTCFPTFND